MGSRNASTEFPSFLIKTTLWCSLIVLIILVPFTVNNFIHGRFLMGLFTSLAALACSLNVLLGLRGRYSVLVNTYIVSPVGAFTITYAFISLGPAGSYWPFLLILAYYFILPEKRVWLVNAITLAVMIPAAWFVLDLPSALRFSAVAMGTSLFGVVSLREINALQELLQKEAVTDHLTGLLNRTLLTESLDFAIAQHGRTNVPMTLLALDIDDFKTINDSFGHDVGDEVLRRLAVFLQDRTRRSDRTFRIGGEEFLILLYDTDEPQALVAAEQLRSEIAAAALLPERTITVSVGISTLRPEMDATTWMKESDENLYRAKEGGRNRVVA